MKYLFIGIMSVIFSVTQAYFFPAPSMAQFEDVRQHLNSLPKTYVVFPKGTTGTTIQNAENHIYILRAKAGQTLTLKLNSGGARASVTLYGVNGKPLSPVLNGPDQNNNTFVTRLTETGDYYIVGGSGPTYHSYDFTVTIK